MAAVTKRRVALVGTGFRGAGTWGKELLATCGEWVELVGLSDSNPMRLERARAAIGVHVPAFADCSAMLTETRPDTLIVCTPDDTHARMIVTALEAGVDVLTEKPMTTTAEMCRTILAAERRTGRRVDVGFNYRFSPTARAIKEVLLSGIIGEIVSVDFHWYLDVQHGADYFRRWHAFIAHSGSLFVHKATHHFDLLNWYLGADPEEVFARGALRRYGRAGPFRGPRCKLCPHADECDFFFDLARHPWLETLYEDPSREDGYVRDACVFREEIDIFDTMTAAILYQNGVQVSYSLNTFLPIEGYHLAFNGKKGRVQIRQYERQAWETPAEDEILVLRNFGPAERIRVPHQPGGHFGGDPALQRMLFVPDMADPLGQRAGARAGAVSVLCGVAAVDSVRSGAPVKVMPLLGGEA
ncbi:Gfo/Idh/MocA family protein [Mesorhizobium koreense]|uniref:Gfo/Idh/MocA family protein n=1 Tax=Mesorhizobium koreense TaxID=3074855 RepID=UPI00287B86BE|nr:Gfo/Idh/MocA family oxidoreductase [Mesorhizobium sp. WR6]